MGDSLPKSEQRLIDVDFSLAMHNRTGKFFIGRDVIDTPGLPLGKVYYWIHSAGHIPCGIKKKLLGRLQFWHVRANTTAGMLSVVPVRVPRRPLLHLDPFTVATTRLRRCDIVLCHDIGPMTHPDLFPPGQGDIYQRIYDEIAQIGPHVVFVSQATKAEFMKSYPDVDLASSRVIYPAIRTNLLNDAQQPVAGLNAPFLLTVGSLGDRKNQARCIAAFAQSKLYEQGVRYVLCGAREPGAERVLALAAATPGVVVLNYVRDAELNWLYRMATGFVLASVLEGFGMPVSEAIARSQVPLVSWQSVLQEVAGEGAIAVDPLSEDSIAKGMLALVGMSDAELAKRRHQLKLSNERFSLNIIQQQWRLAFASYTLAT